MRLSNPQIMALTVPATMLAGAYFFQYGMDLFPCEMCWWQRYGHFAALAFAGLSFVPKFAKPAVFLAALAVLSSALIGAFHAGVEYKWWEGITSCALADVGGANALDAIWNAPITRCDEAAWSLAGISMAGWNFILSLLGAAVIFSANIRKGV